MFPRRRNLSAGFHSEKVRAKLRGESALDRPSCCYGPGCAHCARARASDLCAWAAMIDEQLIVTSAGEQERSGGFVEKSQTQLPFNFSDKIDVFILV